MTTTDALAIKLVRRELLAMLKVIYPTALSAEVIYRALLGAFPQIAWEHLRKDLAYLLEKGYLIRRPEPGIDEGRGETWRRDRYRLSAAGVELVDCCSQDAALEV